MLRSAVALRKITELRKRFAKSPKCEDQRTPVDPRRSAFVLRPKGMKTVHTYVHLDTCRTSDLIQPLFDCVVKLAVSGVITPWSATDTFSPRDAYITPRRKPPSPSSSHWYQALTSRRTNRDPCHRSRCFPRRCWLPSWRSEPVRRCRLQAWLSAAPRTTTLIRCRCNQECRRLHHRGVCLP